MDAGAFSVLKKPIKMDRIRTLVERILQFEGEPLKDHENYHKFKHKSKDRQIFIYIFVTILLMLSLLAFFEMMATGPQPDDPQQSTTDDAPKDKRRSIIDFFHR